MASAISLAPPSWDASPRPAPCFAPFTGLRSDEPCKRRKLMRPDGVGPRRQHGDDRPAGRIRQHIEHRGVWNMVNHLVNYFGLIRVNVKACYGGNVRCRG